MVGLGKKINPPKAISFWGVVIRRWGLCSLLLFLALFAARKTVSPEVSSTRVEGTGGIKKVEFSRMQQDAAGC